MPTSRIKYKQEEEDSRGDFLSAKRQNPIANTVLTLAVVQKVLAKMKRLAGRNFHHGKEEEETINKIVRDGVYGIYAPVQKATRGSWGTRLWSAGKIPLR